VEGITGEWRRLHYEELYEMFGIAAHYGLDGPGIEYRWGRDFPHPSRLALWPTQPPKQRIQGIFRR
jgi:hypothetical protein